MTTGEDDDEPVGTLAEEAAKLLGAVSGWARGHGDGLTGLGDLAEGLRRDHADGPEGGRRDGAALGADCAWCPVCRVVHAVRHTSPEVREHFGNAASSLLLAVSEWLSTTPPPAEHQTDGLDEEDDP